MQEELEQRTVSVHPGGKAVRAGAAFCDCRCAQENGAGTHYPESRQEQHETADL